MALKHPGGNGGTLLSALNKCNRQALVRAQKSSKRFSVEQIFKHFREADVVPLKRSPWTCCEQCTDPVTERDR